MSEKKENTTGSRVNKTKGEEAKKEKEETEDDLLRKLEEQNKYVSMRVTINSSIT